MREDSRTQDSRTQHGIREVGAASEASPVSVRRDRPEEEGRHRRRPRRDQPRGRRPGPADAGADHQEPPGARREPGVPPVRAGPGGARAEAVDRRCSARPRYGLEIDPDERDPAADRLEGRDRPLPAGGAQPRRHQPRSRPLLSGLPLEQHVRRRATSTRCRWSLGSASAPTSTPSPPTSTRSPADVPRTIRTTPPAARPTWPSSSGWSASPGRTTSSSPRTPPTTRCTSSRRRRASSRSPARRTSRSSSTACRRRST